MSEDNRLVWVDAYHNADYSREGYSVFNWGLHWGAYPPGQRVCDNGTPISTHPDRETAKQACQDHWDGREKDAC